jgi:predicted ATPase with chaperone activity
MDTMNFWMDIALDTLHKVIAKVDVLTMNDEEALETAAIHSLRGSDHLRRDWRRRPFRSPHHTASGVALVGGGSNPRPGEISLAHNGVLFLDDEDEDRSYQFQMAILESDIEE